MKKSLLGNLKLVSHSCKLKDISINCRYTLGFLHSLKNNSIIVKI